MRIATPFALALAALLVTGCAPHRQVGMPTPLPSATPAFATEEEALAAAEVAYAGYSDAADQILAEGGVNPERMKPWVTGAEFASDLDGFRTASSKGYHTVGKSTFDQMTVQQYSPTESGVDYLSVYVCVDNSEVDVVDAVGQSVVPVTRPDRSILQVTFDLGDRGRLLVAGVQLWSNDPC